MIEPLFNYLIATIAYKRKTNPLYQGKSHWQLIKAVTRPFDDQTQVKWKVSIVDDNDFKEIMSLPEYTINGYGENKIDEHNHYLIQLVRLPQKELATLTKVLQVAINIGQLFGVWSSPELNFLSDRQLESLKTYLDDEQIDLLNQFLSQHPDLVKQIEFAINSDQ